MFENRFFFYFISLHSQLVETNKNNNENEIQTYVRKSAFIGDQFGRYIGFLYLWFMVIQLDNNYHFLY